MPDLDSYFERIAYGGPTRANRSVLDQIILAHVQAIPFENLDPFLGRPISLGLEAIERKLVQQGRGGYCYEHNMLLHSVLRALGFKAHGLAARVLWNRGDDVLPARTHMLLLVEVGGRPHIVDAGFGGQTLTVALGLRGGQAVETPHGTYRLDRKEDGWVLAVRAPQGWLPLYSFDLAPQAWRDYEIANHYLSSHPESRFRRRLMVAAVRGSARLSLLDLDYTVRRPAGATQTVRLASAAQIMQVLAAEFGIELSGLQELPVRLSVLPQGDRADSAI